LQLVFVGKEDFFYKRLKKFSQDLKVEDIVFLGYVPDYELDTLFYNVAVFVWPTLYEGFGLPPLEAMAKGSPVASSDHACMKEVLGDSAHYFDGKNSLDMEKAILGILNDENLRNKLVKKGYERILKYSWKEMAKKTLFLYKKIIENEK
jgi:glycosyltransferase involved in cell wall biosynthesis